MRAPPFLQSLLVGLCMLLSVACSSGSQHPPRSVAVVGTSECLDCAEKNVRAEHAFKGLHVAVKCKTGNGMYETKAIGELDERGSFNVQLPHELLREDGELKEDCSFAQLHGVTNAPCPGKNGLSPSKIVLTKSKENGKHAVVTEVQGKLSFASSTCTSAFLWPYYKYPGVLPKWHPFDKFLPWHKPKLPFHDHHYYFPPKPYFPPVYKKPLPPPVPVYKKPLPPPVPVFKKPLPPPVPIYKKPLPPPVPVFKKPLPPPVPVYKKPLPPPVPVYKKPLPPPVPVYKKPLPPPVPIYKKPLPPPVPVFKKPLPPPVPVYKKPLPPPVPVYKKPLPPPVPIYKKPLPPPVPVYTKPLPPPVPYYKPPKFHFIHKKPLPPIPQLPPLYHPHPKLLPPVYKKPWPPIPQLPPFFHPHPKFKKPWPPLPPYPYQMPKYFKPKLTPKP